MGKQDVLGGRLTLQRRKDFWEGVAYLSEMWPDDVLDKFSSSLNLKVQLLQKQPT